MTDGKINVGVSIGIAEGNSIWDSELNQNLAFLVMLLRKIEQLGQIFLINGGSLDRLPASMGFEGLGVKLVNPADITHDVDLVIEVGVSLPLEWLRHVRALGTRIVTLFVGHPYADQAESPIFQRSGGAIFVGTPWHEIWTLPQLMKTSGPMLQTVGRVPVHEMPHIWSPLFLQRQIDAVQQPGERPFGFRPRPKSGWRVAIFEPNISVVQSCFIPMLVCDQSYRANPDSVSHMMVMNTLFMKEHLTFNRFASHLDLTRDNKASYEPRLAFAECMMSQKIDAVVAHQWECGLNYAYYDALYGGYPLIHNSEFLQAQEIGFYYPHFEAKNGSAVFLDAWGRDENFWKDYKERASVYLKTLCPDNQVNISIYQKRIMAVMGDQS